MGLSTPAFHLVSVRLAAVVLGAVAAFEVMAALLPASSLAGPAVAAEIALVVAPAAAAAASIVASVVSVVSSPAAVGCCMSHRPAGHRQHAETAVNQRAGALRWHICLVAFGFEGILGSSAKTAKVVCSWRLLQPWRHWKLPVFALLGAAVEEG